MTQLAEYESTHREGSPSDALVPWTICIKAAVNDTELPGYRVDYEKREISFRWQDAYQCFFREVVCINKTILKKVCESTFIATAVTFANP